MSQLEKLMKKFAQTPQRVRYLEIEKILTILGCEKISAKGSHMKWKHRGLHYDIIIPVHRNECKDFYKVQVRKQVQLLLKKFL